MKYYIACKIQKGALFIEYAIILAFVVFVGVFFINENGIPENINNIFSKVELYVASADVNGKDPAKDSKSEYASLLTDVLGKNLIADKIGLLGKSIISGGTANSGNGKYLAELLAEQGIDSVFILTQMNATSDAAYALSEAGLLPANKNIKLVTVADNPDYKITQVGDKYTATQYLYYLSKIDNKDTAVLAATRKVQVEVTKVQSTENSANQSGQPLRYKFADETGTIQLGNNNLGSDKALNTDVSGWVRQ